MPKRRCPVAGESQTLAARDVEQRLGVAEGATVTTIGYDSLPGSPAFVVALFAYIVITSYLCAIAAAGLPIHPAVAPVLLWGVPLLYILIRYRHKLTVIASGAGIVLLSKHGPLRWVPWSDVIQVRKLYGVRGGSDCYYFRHRSGHLGMGVAPDSARIAETAVFVIQMRQLGCDAPAATLDHGIPSDSSLSRAARRLSLDAGRAISVAKAPAVGEEPAEL